MTAPDPGRDYFPGLHPLPAPPPYAALYGPLSAAPGTVPAHGERDEMSDTRDVPESREVQDEEFWRNGGGFHWCWPKFNIGHPANRRPRALLNRYPHNVIGCGIVLFGRYWGVRWKSG